MGSKGVAQPAPPTGTGVCCMCGDRGLPQELFKCRVCLLRSQHKYCSNLYPRVESHSACNWCLRLEEEGNTASSKDQAAAAAGNNSSAPPPSNYINNNTAGKLTRGAFPKHLNKAVKKLKVQERRSEEMSPGSGKGKPVFRGKARRYKLLEDVSS